MAVCCIVISGGLLITNTCQAQRLFSKNVIVYPAPDGEPLCKDYTVTVQEQPVPVYIAKVGASNEKLRAKGMDDKQGSAGIYDLAAFASFDIRGSVTVTVSNPAEITAVKVLPASAHIQPVIHGKSVSFTVTASQNLTVEINGEIFKSLHLFANPFETNKPAPNDTNVIYFGPGIHEISRLVVKDHQTVYIAGGAIVRTVVLPDEKFSLDTRSGLKHYAPSIELAGKHIRVCGRGIIDASACPTHARNMLFVHGAHITLEGIILRDASVWTIPVRQSDNVTINNVKLLGYRANSDGIDICNSTNVTVKNSFIRTLDDLVVVKADKGQGPTAHILVKDCVLWNQLAHALSIGAEIRENIQDVTFTNCDIIHDTGREWLLRVFQCDAGTISHTRFENIRIEDGRRLACLWIGKAIWSRDSARGHIQDVVFTNITASGTPLTVELKGYGQENRIKNVSFSRITVNGKALKQENITMNEFVDNLHVKK